MKMPNLHLSPHRHYVAELRKRLPPRVFEPVPHRVLWIIPFALAATAGVLAIGLFYPPIHFALVISVAIGLAFACLGFLGHEIVHGSIVRARWLRDVLGGICLAPVTVSPTMWRLWHNVEHHGNTQIAGEDPDAYSTFDQYLRRPGLQVLHRIVPARSILFFALLSVWFTVHSILSLRRSLRDYPKLRLRILVETALPVALWLTLGWQFGLGAFIFFYVLPLLVNNFVVMSMIATNHLLNPLLEEDDPLAGSLSLRVPKLMDVLQANFSHHTEHHIFPAMSAKYLPQVKRLLKQLWPDRYNELPILKALALLWKTPRLYLDNVRLIDPATRSRYGVLGHGLDPERMTPLD